MGLSMDVRQIFVFFDVFLSRRNPGKGLEMVNRCVCPTYFRSIARALVLDARNVGARNTGVRNVGARNAGVRNAGARNAGARNMDARNVSARNIDDSCRRSVSRLVDISRVILW